eukprot:TRINITY_DN49982_c0_g1_i1.p1 TRINITY_DN49982_c0_g1~~TRINITY_DN49982_c0_g1_i1.p1  ORF type:complete len:508 (+),score=80.64 TRINITY_DN49982_c0_g1_i1:76-1524(+)
MPGGSPPSLPEQSEGGAPSAARQRPAITAAAVLVLSATALAAVALFRRGGPDTRRRTARRAQPAAEAPSPSGSVLPSRSLLSVHSRPGTHPRHHDLAPAPDRARLGFPSRRRFGAVRRDIIVSLPPVRSDNPGGAPYVAWERPRKCAATGSKGILQVRLWGERNSGTNLLWAVLNRNLNIDVDRSACVGGRCPTRGARRAGGGCCMPPPGAKPPPPGAYNESVWQALGMKHVWPDELRSFGAEPLARSPPVIDHRYRNWARAYLGHTLIIAALREPLAWIVANHNIRHYYQPFGGHNMTRFVHSRWDDSLGNKFASPMAWRRAKVQLYVGMARSSPHYEIAHLEDLYTPEGQLKFIKRIACRHGIPLKEPLKAVIGRVDEQGVEKPWSASKAHIGSQRGKPIVLRDGNVVIKRGGAQVFLPKDCAHVVRSIDWVVERKGGYKLTQEALDHFCPLGSGGVTPEEVMASVDPPLRRRENRGRNK